MIRRLLTEPLPWASTVPIPWQDYGLSGLVSLAVVSVLFGWLVPRFYYTAQKAELVELRKANAELIKTNQVLVETNRTLAGGAGAVLGALPAAAAGDGNGSA